MIKNDLTGRTFGRLTVMREHDERSKRGYVQWVCQCSCDRKTILIVPSDRLTGGITKSCGCLQPEIAASRNAARARYPKTDRTSRLYGIWRGIRARATYESQDCYKNYGSRGIKMCDEWKQDFIAFKTGHFHMDIKKI